MTMLELVYSATRHRISWAESSDRDLLLAVREGDEGALAALYDATSRRVFGLALRILGDRAEAAVLTAHDDEGPAVSDHDSAFIPCTFDSDSGTLMGGTNPPRRSVHRRVQGGLDFQATDRSKPKSSACPKRSPRV